MTTTSGPLSTPDADAPLAGALTTATIPETAPSPAPEPESTGTALRRLIRRVHFYAGVLTAPFLAVLCLTGIAYVFTPQITDARYAQQLLVEPRPGRWTPRSPPPAPPTPRARCPR